MVGVSGVGDEAEGMKARDLGELTETMHLELFCPCNGALRMFANHVWRRGVGGLRWMVSSRDLGPCARTPEGEQA